MTDLAHSSLMLAALFQPRQLWMAMLVTLVFTALARWARGVSVSGAVAGAVVCLLLYAGAGPGAFAALVSVFALTWISTRLGYQRKQRLGTAQSREGRTASQVLANLAVAAGCAGLSAISGKSVFLFATAAALSEAAADTVSSEIGQARHAKARLITTWQEVSAGTDGGVSNVGTVSGVVAATLVSLVCALGGVVPLRWCGIPAIAGVTGMIADSLLGALLERRKLLGNDWVNFLGTAVAALVAVLLAWMSGFR